MGHLSNMAKVMPSLRNRTPEIEYTPAGVSDDFTGVNGADAHAGKWTTIDGEIQSNKWNFYSNVTGSGRQDGGLTANWNVSGEFKIYLDYDIKTFEIDPSGNQYVLQFYVYMGDRGYWMARRTSGGTHMWLAQQYNGATHVETVYWYTELDTSSMAFWRTASNQVRYAAHWGGSPPADTGAGQWEWNNPIYRTFSGTCADDTTMIMFRCRQYDGYEVDIDIDNFVCSYADSIFAA